MKLHGRSAALLPLKTFVRPTERRAILNEASWSFRRCSPPAAFVRPASGARLEGLSVFLHIFAETIKIFLQKRIVYVKILLDFFV